MSWARQDDLFFKHPKTTNLLDKRERIRASGLAAIGAFWTLNSYTQRTNTGEFSTWEAMMLLRIDQEAVDEILTLLQDVPEGKERGFIVDIGGGNYRIHNWNKYRTKNAKKVHAGSLGGKKSGEARRRKAQETDTPVPPATDSVVPLDEEDERELSMEEVEQIGHPKYGGLGGANITKVGRLAPIRAWELKHAMTTEGTAWGYAVKVIESIRREAAQEKPPPAGARRRKPDAAETTERAGAAFLEEVSRGKKG